MMTIQSYVRRGVLLPMVLLGMLDHPAGAVLPLADGFEGYTNGTDLSVVNSNGWSAIGAGVVVQTNQVSQGEKAAAIGISAALYNALDCGGAQRVWTDCRLRAVYDVLDADAGAADVCMKLAVNENGYVSVLSNATWAVCSNDVWGGAVAPLTAGTWSRVTLFQDYSDHKVAVFLEGRLLIQLLGYVGTPAGYTRLMISNSYDSAAYLDGVYVGTNVPGGLESLDYDGDGLADCGQVTQYGYVPLTRTVGSGQQYASLTAALAAARDHDRICIVGGAIFSNVTFSKSVLIYGAALVITGDVTVVSGTTVTISNAMTCTSNTTVQTGGLLAITAGTLTTTNLTLVGSGQLSAVAGGLVADGLALSGTFTLGAGWASGLVPVSPDFSDNFESYATGTRAHDLGYWGWSASGTDVVAMSGTGYLNSKGLLVPEMAALTNSVYANGGKRFWTDYRIQATLGDLPLSPSEAGAAMEVAIDPNGYLVVSSNGGWRVCSNDALGMAISPVASGTWVRISVYGDYAKQKVSVFLNGRPLCQEVGFLNPVLDHTAFAVINDSGDVMVDDYGVYTNVPPVLIGDWDHDGINDADEIQSQGNLYFLPLGTVFLIR